MKKEGSMMSTQRMAGGGKDSPTVAFSNFDRDHEDFKEEVKEKMGGRQLHVEHPHTHGHDQDLRNKTPLQLLMLYRREHEGEKDKQWDEA